MPSPIEPRYRKAFTAVEELDDAARALGWNIEYRQMGSGGFSAEFADLESDEISFATETIENHLHIHSEPPESTIGFFFPAGDCTALGGEIQDGDVIAFPSRTELEIATRGRVSNETLFMREADFFRSANALAPSASLFGPGGSAQILNGDRDRSAALRSEIRSLFMQRNSGHRVDAETASDILAKLILWLAESSAAPVESRLSDNASIRVARRARSFIEEHYREMIKMEGLCESVGVGLRTLQRCFALHFQISPTSYIKARRLNAARRALAAGDPDHHSVTTIAMDCGFTHLGRFSVDYRSHFGESPRETLAAR